MPRYSYERLSAQDNSFLVFETPELHMHVASTQVFELGPLETPDGGVDYALIKRFIASVLELRARVPGRHLGEPPCGSPRGTSTACARARTTSPTGSPRAIPMSSRSRS